jgi:hypothetical protein
MWFNLLSFQKIASFFKSVNQEPVDEEDLKKELKENKNQKLATEFNFSLPRGFVDKTGKIHREGIMRLATARDEIKIFNNQKVKENSSYAVLVYLSQVIIRLGELTSITPQMLEDLYLLDLAYLKAFYNQINQHRTANIPVICPYCQQDFSVEFSLLGES